MVKRLYLPSGAPTDTLDLVIDPQVFTESGDNAMLALVTEFQGLSDVARAEVGVCNGFSTLVDYDAFLSDQEKEIRDRLDYYDYLTRVVNLTVADGAWFSPDLVDSFCGEEVGQEATRAIDANFATFWRHATNHQHSIVFKIRGYPKKVAKIRFRYGAGESARERLNNMDVHAAGNINKIDDPANILETGINIAWPTGAGQVWVEHVLAKKKNKAKFIKLVVDDTDNGNNQIQIREFEVWVETRDP